MMKKILFILSLLAITYVIEAQAFEYNDHGKHDPFWPLVSNEGSFISYDGEVVVADIVLQGILLDPQGNNVALINGKIAKPGDKVGGYTIETVANDHVDLSKDQERMSVKLKKGKV